MSAVAYRHRELPFQRLKLETIVVDTASREVHCLNPTAARIWDLLESEATVEELIDTLSAEYDVERATLAADVHALIDEMEAKGLLAR